MITTFSKTRYRPYLALGVGILSLGFSAIFVRWARAPGAVVSFYRMAIATTFLAWPFFKRIKTHGKLPRRGVWLAILGGLFFAADLAFWTEGVNRSGATNPTLLANTAPVWVGLGTMFLFREKLNSRFWMGLLLAILGAGVIVGLDSLQGFSLGLGTALGLVSGFFYGGYFLITQRGRETLNSLTYFWPAAVSSTIWLLLLSLVSGQPLNGYPLQTYVSLLGLGLVTQVIGYLAINDALGYLPASIVSPTMLGQPVVTALLAGPLLGEVLTGWQIFGGMTVLAGVYTVHRSRSR